ncbi:MAG: 16S rRNA (guanine(527)-N(7))-methyltransferase RsmG [Cyclobacteriaceae bacterium]|nr:16S rRNA (guanine(527)-N(7))-methyltransferase RsmG [Cyclobacteriaceae bacterium]
MSFPAKTSMSCILRHVLHSLSIARFFNFDDGASILDIGTGGGFPGIPLSIMFENVRFTLVDSIGKKIHVVEDVIDKLQLQNAAARQMRAEEIKDQYDFVVCRAVADSADIIRWTGKLINKGKSVSGISHGLICLKGGDLAEELSTLRWGKKVHEIASIFHEDFFQTKKVVHLWRN